MSIGSGLFVVTIPEGQVGVVMKQEGHELVVDSILRPGRQTAWDFGLLYGKISAKGRSYSYDRLKTNTHNVCARLSHR